jgi:SAM-dependent methyltransferase
MDFEERDWFKYWFNTPYYHILYHDRDESEAGKLIENLKKHLQMPSGGRVLDLACGRGRHALYMAHLGFDVTGIDLSEENINYAKKFEDENLHFYKHDMRKPFRSNYFDFVLNMFSSFGYFKTDKEHQDSIKYAATALKKNGVFVLDFFNVDYVLNNLVPEEVKTIEEIDFHISRQVKDGYIFKNIVFKEKDETQGFSERVKLLKLEDFKNYFSNAGLEIIETKGDYSLKKYNQNNSPRLILIARKK